MGGRRRAYTDFAQMASFILYGHALKECFVNVVWTMQGLLLFFAITVTVTRYFLASALYNGKCFVKNKSNHLCCIWMSIFLAGLASLAARHQGDNLLLYVVPVMAAVDLLWTSRAYRAVTNGATMLNRAKLRSRMAIDVVLVGFFIALFIVHQPSVYGKLNAGAASLAVAGLVTAAVVDLLLNYQLYEIDS